MVQHPHLIRFRHFSDLNLYIRISSFYIQEKSIKDLKHKRKKEEERSRGKLRRKCEKGMQDNNNNVKVI